MKKPKLMVMTFIIMFSLILGACGGGAADRVRQEQLSERKESTSEKLHDILYEIEERIEIVEHQMEEARGELQEELEELNTALKEQRETIEKELELINEATLETWNDVIDNTSEMLRKVRSKTNEITRELREIMED